MDAKSVVVPVGNIIDWASFHDVFKATFGFPDFQGRNMDAWIDCMTSLDENRWTARQRSRSIPAAWSS